jgi:hypothetical protein
LEPPHLRKRGKTASSIGRRSRREQPSMGNVNEFFGKTIGLEFGK